MVLYILFNNIPNLQDRLYHRRHQIILVKHNQIKHLPKIPCWWGWRWWWWWWWGGERIKAVEATADDNMHLRLYS